MSVSPVSKGQALRAKAVFFLVTVGLAAAAVRLYSLQIGRHEVYAKDLAEQSLRLEEIMPIRGRIITSDGIIAAASHYVDSVYAVPGLVQDAPATARKLSEILGVPADELLVKFADNGRKFVWLKRKVTPEQSVAVTACEFQGIGLRQESKRFYPLGRNAAHVLGFVGMDEKGLEGVELRANEYLSGRPGRRWVSRDAMQRRMLSDYADAEPVVQGEDVVITLDSVIQSIVEEEADRACEEWRPKSAVIVVVNPQTGDLLALTNRPTFDPNSYGESPADSRRNRCLTDPQEPGSTFKPFVAGSVLDEGLITTDAKVFCENGLFRVGKRLVHDHHPYGMLSFTDVIVKSSNIGAAKLGLMLGIEKLHSHVTDFGFGELTGIELPGESVGIVRPKPVWRTSTTVVSVSFGHEIAVTPVQLARGFCVFANGGYLPPLRLVRSIGGKSAPDVWGERPSRQVLSAGTVAKMKAILAEVTISGTGKKAQLEGYGVAGKTGTAQKRNPDGHYSHDKFCSYFVGFGPVDRPNVLVMVMLDEPQGAYYGGTVAAPVVGKIIDRSLKYMEVPPADSGKKERE